MNNTDIPRRKFLKILTYTSIGLLIPYSITTKAQKSEANIRVACGLIVMGLGAFILSSNKQGKNIGIEFNIKLRNGTNRTERVNLYFRITNEYGQLLRVNNNIIQVTVPRRGGTAWAKWRWRGSGYTDSLYLTVDTDCKRLVNRQRIQEIL